MMLEQFLAALTAGSRRETFASGFGCVLFEVMCGCFCLFVLVLGFFFVGFCFFLFCLMSQMTVSHKHSIVEEKIQKQSSQAHVMMATNAWSESFPLLSSELIPSTLPSSLSSFCSFLGFPVKLEGSL